MFPSCLNYSYLFLIPTFKQYGNPLQGIFKSRQVLLIVIWHLIFYFTSWHFKQNS